jgi:hypothetical protein
MKRMVMLLFSIILVLSLGACRANTQKYIKNNISNKTSADIKQSVSHVKKYL